MSRPLRIQFPGAWYHVINRGRRRGIYNEPRNVTIYLFRQLRGDSLIDIGEKFGLSHYSSVSSVIHNVEHRLKPDQSFKKKQGMLY